MRIFQPVNSFAAIHAMNDQTENFRHRRMFVRHPSGILLVAQLVSLILYAALDGTPSGRTLLGVFGMVLLVLVVWVINRSHVIRWIAWLLAPSAAALSVLSWITVSDTLTVCAALLSAGLYFYAAGSLIVYMMSDERVTADEVFAAGATFTVIAWGFTFLYQLCQVWSPHCFAGVTNPEQQRTFLELLFLSFTNLSATGLSDIVPVTPPARVLVMLEQFAGIAYLAVVVSRLVGMSIRRAGRSRQL